MNLSNDYITESKKKIYTVPEGEYKGTWQNNFVWVFKDDVVIARIDTKLETKKQKEVLVIIENTKAKIYERSKTKQKL